MKYLMYFLGVFLTISLGNGEMGIADISPKIVGGSNARLEDFPYMASLRDRNNWFTCGAVIIGTNWGMSGKIPILPLIANFFKYFFLKVHLKIRLNPKFQNSRAYH
jgi:hypothetical protein